MRKLSDTIARLAAMKAARPAGYSAASGGRLEEFDAFGSDPGNLRGLLYVPAGVAEQPALVVVLHGCTQTASAYDAGSGWSLLADLHGFVVLFPEQRRANNANLCFNWFAPADARRESGECLSIRQMIAHVADLHRVDPARVFVTGLSAGGAMTSVMLATYPETFAGGAIVAGLPYGSATSIPEAFDRMRGQGGPGAEQLTALVRNASPHAGPWPSISVWHGTRDATVDAANAEAILSQWRALHGVGTAPDIVDAVDGQTHRLWRNADGRAVIEEYSIAGMGHGTPLGVTSADGREVAGPYMLDAGISSTTHIAAFWGLLSATNVDRAEEARPVNDPATVAAASAKEHALPSIRTATRIFEPAPATAKPTQAEGVGKIIEDALRAAGLMR